MGQIPSSEDLKVLVERQLTHPVQNVLAVEGVSTRCLHGFSRAFIMYPCGGDVVSSGMIRLTCPWLVKCVDTHEKDMLSEMNEILAMESKEGEEFRENFKSVNDAWRRIKERSISDDEESLIERSLGIEGKKFILESGFIGVTSEADAKCLHAHIADSLLRGNNKIGEWALNKLVNKYGVNVKGCDSCFQQCDLKFEPTQHSWWYTPVKNKQKLRTKRLRRIQQREQAEKD